MTGKLADTVMSVRNGEQVARKYQPVVYNPSTPAQVANRAKLKLMSQLSAVMAPVIAIARQGSVSARNLFTKENYRLASYSENTATINLDAIQLTKSVVSLPALTATRDGGTLTVGLSVADLELDRVVYCVFVKDDDDEMRFVTSLVQQTPGDDHAFSSEIPTSQGNRPLVVYAYGVRDNTDAARVIFGNMTTPTATAVAQLVASRTLTETDVTLTETHGITVDPATAATNADVESTQRKKK